jgi:hypothetical protein
MSHPNPSHDPENVYPSDNYKPVAKKMGAHYDSKTKTVKGKIKKVKLSGPTALIEMAKKMKK